jgi:cytochrome c biogenesis protein CcdA
MILFAVSYFAGMLTIVSPCILPVLPFVFTRAEQPFLRSGLPMLAGMAFTFAGAATLAAVGGSWAVEANEYGRLAAIVLLAVFGLTLLVPELAEWMTRPLSPPVPGFPNRSGRAGLSATPPCCPRSCSASPPASSGRPAPVRSSAWC